MTRPRPSKPVRSPESRPLLVPENVGIVVVVVGVVAGVGQTSAHNLTVVPACAAPGVGRSPSLGVGHRRHRRVRTELEASDEVAVARRAGSCAGKRRRLLDGLQAAVPVVAVRRGAPRRRVGRAVQLGRPDQRAELHVAVPRLRAGGSVPHGDQPAEIIIPVVGHVAVGVGHPRRPGRPRAAAPAPARCVRVLVHRRRRCARRPVAPEPAQAVSPRSSCAFDRPSQWSPRASPDRRRRTSGS